MPVTSNLFLHFSDQKWKECHESVVAQWLGPCLWCQRSQVRSPLAARKLLVSKHAFSSVICRDDTR